MMIVMVCAPQLVTLAYKRGRFDAGAVTMVSDALRGLAVGAAFMMAVYIMMRIISAQMRNRENIAPMAIAALVEGGAAVLLVPRLGLLGVGLAVSFMQVTLCALLAARVGLLSGFGRRLPGWIVGLGAVGLAAALAERVGTDQGLGVRLALTSVLVGGAWVVANALTGPTRADLAALMRHVGRAYGQVQARFATR
jgi:peptidoglycan biosynthesis protein MviN/MurJ (putative lipid II flippase)